MEPTLNALRRLSRTTTTGSLEGEEEEEEDDCGVESVVSTRNWSSRRPYIIKCLEGRQLKRERGRDLYIFSFYW